MSQTTYEKFKANGMSLTCDDYDDSFVDDYGVRYSSDGTVLLQFEEELSDCYSVRLGCKAICGAFSYEEDAPFEHCPENLWQLEELIIPEGVEVIGPAVFEESNIAQLLIPRSVKEIGADAFGSDGSGESALCEVIVESEDVSIFSRAFNDHPNLTTVAFTAQGPNTRIELYGGAFAFCTGLREISIPAAKCVIHQNPFEGCYIEEITFDLDKRYLFKDGFLLFDDETTNDCVLIGYYGTEPNVIVPDRVTVIGDCAFNRNQNIKSVVLPEGVRHIGKEAFGCCMGHPAITLSGTVEVIDEYAFDDVSCIKVPSGTRNYFTKFLPTSIADMLEEFTQ